MLIYYLILSEGIAHDDEIQGCARLLVFGHISHVIGVFVTDETRITRARVKEHQARETERTSWRRKNDESDLPPAV